LAIVTFVILAVVSSNFPFITLVIAACMGFATVHFAILLYQGYIGCLR
jgi:hypothetical protein